jgi:hypothetical protein
MAQRYCNGSMRSSGRPAFIRSQLASSSGPQAAGEYYPVKAELRVIALVLRMEMGRPMLLVEHPNDDAKEG